MADIKEHINDHTLEEDTSSSNEIMLRDILIARLRSSGIEVITDKKEVKELLDNYQALGNSYIRYQSVFHGSGVNFDHFDHSHMGEGEGAQSHGWGTYVTLDEKVGKKYASKSDQATGLKQSELEFKIHRAEEQLSFLRGEVKASKEKELKNLKDELNNLDKSRYLYIVDIPDNTGYNYLEEDAPLSKEQQKMLAEESEKEGFGDNTLSYRDENGNLMLNVDASNGLWLYRNELTRVLGSPKAASEFLSRAGFTGIHYNGREDGNCYVIFDDKDLNIEDKIKFFKTSNGDAYGFTLNNKIYVDTDIANSETPIHEYAHLWASALRAGNEHEWNNVVALMKQQTDLWNSVKSRYPQLSSDDDIADEVLATYSGQRGAKFLREQVKVIMGADEEKATSMLDAFEEAIKRFWHDVAELFHIHYTSSEQVADQIMSDMLHGINPSEVKKEAFVRQEFESLVDSNKNFNERLSSLMEDSHQKDQRLRLGYASTFLREGGLAEGMIFLQYNKILRKSSENYENNHPYDIASLRNLPMAIAYPISVFENTNDKKAGSTILTELRDGDHNFIVAVKTVSEHRANGVSMEINDITTLFPKDEKGIVNWYNTGKATNIDKKKALRFISSLQTHSGNEINSEELSSAANIINKFEKAKYQEDNFDKTFKEVCSDRRYVEAVASGHIGEARQMLAERAKSNGYLPADYQGKDSWTAPIAEVEPTDFENKEALQQMVDDFGREANVYGIINGIQGHDSDYYYNPNAVGFHGKAADETSEILRRLRDEHASGDAQVDIYRVVPNDVVGSQIMQGDWVALSKIYCDELGKHKFGDGNYHIIEAKAAIKNLWMGDEDMREFGFDDGHGDVEKNVRHNRKILDITYDDEGKLIPLSQRFSENNEDIRFQLSDDDNQKYKSNINGMSEENSTKDKNQQVQEAFEKESMQEVNKQNIDDTLDKDAIADGYANNMEKQWDEVVKMFGQDENLFDQLTTAASGQPLDSVKHTDKFDIIHDFINQFGGKKELGAETETTTGALYNSHSVAQLNLNDGSVLEVNDYSKAFDDSVKDVQELSHVRDGAIIDSARKEIGGVNQKVNQEALNNLWSAFVGSAPMNRIHEKQIVNDKEKAVGQKTLRTENRGKTKVISTGKYYTDSDRSAVFALNWMLSDMRNGHDVNNHISDYVVSRQEFSHQIKAGNVSQIEPSMLMSHELLGNIGQGNQDKYVLVPIPEHTGKADYTLQLAEHIGAQTGIEVIDLLESKEHAEFYEVKKNRDTNVHDPEKVDFGIKVKDGMQLPNGKLPILVDNVLDTGKTISDSAKALDTKEHMALVFANTDNWQEHPSYNIEVVSPAHYRESHDGKSINDIVAQASRLVTVDDVNVKYSSQQRPRLIQSAVALNYLNNIRENKGDGWFDDQKNWNKPVRRDIYLETHAEHVKSVADQSKLDLERDVRSLIEKYEDQNAPRKLFNYDTWSDEKLLAYMKLDGCGDSNKAMNVDVYDEYDSRHNSEFLAANDKYMDQFIVNKTSLDEAKKMLDELRQADMSLWATPERIDLDGKENALVEYIKDLSVQQKNNQSLDQQQVDSLKPVDGQSREVGHDEPESLSPSDEDKKLLDSSKEEIAVVKPSAANNEQTYYAEVAAYMNSEDVQMFDEVKTNEESLLSYASQCDPGEAIDQEYTHKSPYQSKGDNLLAEDDNYAVIFNDESGSNSYTVLRKVSESDVRLNIDRFGLSPDASDDVLDVAKRYVAQQKKESKEEDSKILFDGTREEAWSIVDAIQPYIDDPDITVLLDEWLKATDGYGTPFNTDKEWYKKYAKGKTDHQLVNLYHNAKDFLELVPKEDDKKAVDPIMRVYDQMKAEHPNTILLFKSKDGKSCNSYSDDASKVSEILQLPLFISYDVKDKDGKFVDNCIFPSHDLGAYLPMLVRAGERSVLLDYPPFVEDRINANKLSEVKQETPHEDSDMRTDVTDTAKHIVASDNVPMEQAEKEAKEIADEQVHKDYHQQQDELHAEEEKRKQQEQQEQEKKHKVLNSMFYDVFGMKDGKRDIIKSGLTIIAAANFVERNDELYQRKGYDSLISMPHVEEKLEKVNSETADMAKVQDLQKQQATVRTNSDETEENNQEKNNMNKKEELAEQTKEPSSKEDEKVVNTAAVHAGLLLGALESAKEGIWLNPHGKHGAALLEPGKMITGYNRLMMDLFADKNHYKTNVFTYYDYAKKEEMPVKQGQTSLPIDWTRWDYENVATKEVITKKQYAELTPDKQQDYARHSTKQTRHLYNIDQTAMAGTKVADYSKLVKDNGSKFENIPELPTDKNFLNLTNRLHGKHKDCTIILGEGDKNFAYGKHAEKVGSVMGVPVQSKDIDGKKVSYIEFPHTALDTVLPKMIGSHNKVALCSNVLESKFEAPNNISKNSVRDAATIADKVSRKAGFTLERVLDDVPVSYDKEKDVITYSGNNARQPGRENLAAVEKANDIYRAVVEATGRENRLDREARFNMLPEDNAKYEKLVQELSSGVLMAAHGLPAIISKENRELIPYWEREIKENPKMMAVLEKDVNISIEQIEKHLLGQEVDYAKIRGARPALFDAKDYTVASKMAQLPNADTKEFVIIRNAEKTAADVILPEGATLPEGASLPGMCKERIAHALAKENIKEVHFYNAGGSQGLYKDNDYFAGKTATLTKLKQWDLLPRHVVDISSQYLNVEKKPLIERFKVISDENKKKAFYIKAKGEGQFSVYPAKDYLNAYFTALKNPNRVERSKMLTTLAQRYYAVAQAHPEVKKELIMPKLPKNVDMSKLVKATINRNGEKDNYKYFVWATISGTHHKKEITENGAQVFHHMFLADDMQAYKNAVAANVFESLIRTVKVQEADEGLKIVDNSNVKDVVGHSGKQEQGHSESHSDGGSSDSDDKSESEGQGVGDASSKQADKDKSEEENKSRGFHM